MVHDGRTSPSSRCQPTRSRHLYGGSEQRPSPSRRSEDNGGDRKDAKASLSKPNPFVGRSNGIPRKVPTSTSVNLKSKRLRQTSVIVNQSGQVIGEPTRDFILNHLSLRDAGGNQSCALYRQKTLDIIDHIQTNHVQQRPNEDPTKIRRTNQVTDQPKNRMINHPTDRSISHKTNRPENQPANRPANQPAI